MKNKFRIKRATSLLACCLSTSLMSFCATADLIEDKNFTNPLPYKVMPYHFVSSMHQGKISIESAFNEQPEEEIFVNGAPWLKLDLKGTILGEYSFIEVTSKLDGAKQRITQKTLEKSGFETAYFNGDNLIVSLHIHQNDAGVQLTIPNIMVGERVRRVESICGATDDRVASNETKVARIDPIGCTGWLADNGKILTAGHCLDRGPSRNKTLSFNPPASLPDGTVQFPAPNQQYQIVADSFTFKNNGIGNDWGVFKVENNSVTGKQPIATQGGFKLTQNLSPERIRITGFGVDSGVTNQTNQTHVGPNAGSANKVMRYVTDTMGGNSGSPIIDAATGEAVGVHSHGGCSGGNNHGTSFFNAELWTAATGQIDPPPPPPIPPKKGCDGIPAWKASKVYTTGDLAVLDNIKYRAKWWTKGQNPKRNSGGKHSGKPWAAKGECE